MKHILAIGDCNTLGVAEFTENSYPERLGQALHKHVRNSAYTMATTREGIRLLKDNISEDTVLLLIQFGLVDSYQTFIYAPYVLYYPDNFLKKQGRSLVKKYKKLCRKYGLNRRFGEKKVVPELEYKNNLEQMILSAGNAPVLLIDTIPHKQQERNPRILRYNEILDELAATHHNCRRIHLYKHFLENMDCFYADETHCNSKGYAYITDVLTRTVKSSPDGTISFVENNKYNSSGNI